MATSRAGRLAGKVALVTGGGYGFGAAIVEKFVAEGAKCLIVDTNRRNGKEVALEQASGTASFCYADANKEDDWKEAVEKAVEIFGHLDIVVNNSGASHKMAPATDVPESDLDLVLNSNLKPLYNAVRAVTPIYTAQQHGVILSISSVAAIRPRPSLVWYGGSKAAVNACTEGLASELAPHNIRVNAVLPVAGDVALAPHGAVLGQSDAGSLSSLSRFKSAGSSVVESEGASPELARTEFIASQGGVLEKPVNGGGGQQRMNSSAARATTGGAGVPAATMDKRKGRTSSALPTGIPLGRWASATDVANAAAFLCSDEAEFITGVCLRVDGGAALG